MALLTRHAQLLFALAVLLSILESTSACYATRLNRKVKRKYDRARITRRGKCSPDEDFVQQICGVFHPNSKTYLPNLLGHKTIVNASNDAFRLMPLANINCSRYTLSFLCSVFFPECSKKGRMVLPCRSLCEEVRDGCVDELFGHPWPRPLRCDLFPATDSCFKGRAMAGVKNSGYDFITTAMPTTTTMTPEVIPDRVTQDPDGDGWTECEDTSEVGADDEDPQDVEELERPSECVQGYYNCRFSTVKSYLNGIPHCCFHKKEIVHSVTHNGGQDGELVTSCQCSYPTPALDDEC